MNIHALFLHLIQETKQTPTIHLLKKITHLVERVVDHGPAYHHLRGRLGDPLDVPEAVESGAGLEVSQRRGRDGPGELHRRAWTVAAPAAVASALGCGAVAGRGGCWWWGGGGGPPDRGLVGVRDGRAEAEGQPHEEGPRGVEEQHGAEPP